MSTSRPLAILAEDEALIRMAAAAMLDALGFEVLEAEHAHGALQHLEANSGAVLLYTDVNMPGHMDGLALATRVAERWPRIRLVLTSGRQGLTDDEVPDHGRFVQKPYRQRDLVSAISHAG